MLAFASIGESIAATSSRLAKIALVADYFRSLSPDQAAIAAIFLSGRPFAAYEEATLQVGGSLLWHTIAELSGKSERQLTAIYRRHGDAGAVAADALPEKPEAILSLSDVQRAFGEIAAARGPAAKGQILRQLFERATPLEAKYIVKIISGDLRIGLKESLVEEAIARAFESPVETGLAPSPQKRQAASLHEVQRANMLLGDIGETLRLAAAGRLAKARLRLFHPIGFMLASPVKSATEALSYFSNAAFEDKYDGIRAQAHIRVARAPSPAIAEVRLFSRTRDEITESFPELVPALANISHEAILDGEIVAWSKGGETSVSPVKAEGSSAQGRALPFSTLQQRLGRKKVSPAVMREIPIAFLVFDVLYVDGELLLERPLRERAATLDQILAPTTAAVGTAAPAVHAQRRFAVPGSAAQSSFAFAAENVPLASILRAPVATAHSPEAIEHLFAAARGRGNEGLMVKDLDSLYTPGRRGTSWLKMKRELATLDVVVTAVEYGHGKRIGVLSDYTFAVWDRNDPNEARLVNIGKAYSGLTDSEIAEMTKWFLAHVTRDHGLRLEVEPKIVLEVAFNNMMKSSRHESGYALRFPRIVRLRPDKLPEDADTIETVKEIFERQRS